MLIEIKTSIRFGIIEESELKREGRLKKVMVKFASLFRMIKAHSLGLFCLILLRQVNMWGKGHSCHMGADIVERCSGYPTHFPLSFVEMFVFNSRGLLVLDWIPCVLVWFCGKWQFCMCFLCFCHLLFVTRLCLATPHS
jgi:hypothetical protein